MKETSDNKGMKTSYGIIWRILNTLDLAMDLKELPAKELSAEKFKITETRFHRYLEMLQKAGYIDGLEYDDDLDMEEPAVNVSNLSITLEGIEFLITNSTMNKIAQVAKNLGYIVAEAGADAITTLIK